MNVADTFAAVKMNDTLMIKLVNGNISLSSSSSLTLFLVFSVFRSSLYKWNYEKKVHFSN